MTNLAISYARFSSLKQTDGDSLRRQTEAASAYAAANGLVLDQQRSFMDLGVSAYDQSNIHKGALGLFIKAVDQGQIPVGTTLIVESFDRLSRATPLDALGVFSQIINAGLNIVTLTNPPKKFSRESIKDNVFQLMEALIDMNRANAESLRKSQLISSAWKDKRARAIANGTLMSERAPLWIDVTINPNTSKHDKDRRVAKLNPERAAVVMQIIDMAERGTGNNTIIRTLHKDGVPAWSSSGKWQPSYVQKILQNVALYGAIKLEEEVIPNYYPALIDEGRFHLLQSQRADRATTKNTSRKGTVVTNLFSGKLKCGYCGSSMNIAGYKSLASGYERKYVACHGARTGATQCRMTMWFIDQLEPSLLFWITSIDYSKIMGDGGKTDLVEALEQLELMKVRHADVLKRIENTMIAIEDGAKGMVTRLAERQEEELTLQKTLKELQQRVDTLASRQGGGPARMAGMVQMFKALKHCKDEVQLRTIREQLSAGIAATVKKIVLYPLGRTRKGTKDDRYIEVTFANGAERTIETGEC